MMKPPLPVADFLYKNAFSLYRPLYTWFKMRQDAFQIGLIRKQVHQGDVVLDIGANIGFYTNIFSGLVGPEGRVYCFEPEAENFSHLQQATKDLVNVVIYNKAVGSKNETLKLYISHRLNVDHRTYKPEAYEKEIEMEAVTIDSSLPPNSKVDFIKMDIQGFEVQAVHGMHALLERNQNIKILSEFWPYGLRQTGSSVGEYVSLFKDMGFTCFFLEQNSLSELSPEKVRSLEALGEDQYFNIFVTR